MQRMSVRLAIIAALVLALSPATVDAQGRWRPGDNGSFRIFIGEFEPDASSEYWDDKFVDFTGSPKDFDETGYLYSLLDGNLLKSRTCFTGRFNVTTDASLLWKVGRKSSTPALKLGRSPRAELLKSLEIEETAFQFRFASSMNSCFDLPLESP